MSTFIFLARGQAVAPRVLPAAIAALPVAKPQRARLWELNDAVHCSVIGTCLTAGELRRVMAKGLPGALPGALPGNASATDHDLHSQAVGLCSHPNAVAKQLQRALDRQHETVIKRFLRLHGEPAVLEAWAEHRRAGDIPGAYWAVLTHPDIGHAGVRRAFGDVHMLSHLVGAANRADLRRLIQLEEANAALRDKIERQQDRLQEALSERDATIRGLGALAAGQLRDQPCATGDDEQAGLRRLVADLQRRLDRETTRRERLEARTAELTAAAKASADGIAAATTRCGALERELVMLEAHRDAPDRMPASPQTILYVGGRPGAVEHIGAWLTACGGVLLAHDGGRHDHPSLLPGLIGQADLVAFPVDCVSHDAALAVKRLCRQQAKPWAPLRSSGFGSFLAMLADPVRHEGQATA